MKINVKEIEEYVDNYKSIYEEGLTYDEIVCIMNNYPNINKDMFFNALVCDTGLIKNDEFLTYRRDVKKAVMCGLQNRELKVWEWD